MARVKIKMVEAGQMLSKDAVAANGRLLMKAGTTIEEKHLAIFRTWGVVEVDIVGDDTVSEEESVSYEALPDEVKEKIANKLKHQFKHCNLQHPLIKELVTYRKLGLSKAWMNGETTSI